MSIILRDYIVKAIFGLTVVVSFIASAQAPSAEDFDAYPIGQSTLPDGREILRTKEGETLVLSMPARFRDRYAELATLNEKETEEALGLAPGDHTLKSGKQILKLDSGLVLALPPLAGKVVASSTAVEVEPDVWVEPEIRDAIDALRAQSTKAILASLCGEKSLLNIRELSSERSVEILSVPLDASFGSAMVQSVVNDLRFDRLLKDLSVLDADSVATILEPALKKAIAEQSQRFNLLLGEARRNGLSGDLGSQPDDIGGRMDLVWDALAQSGRVKSSPHADFAYGMLLLLAGNLRCVSLHSTLLEAAAEAKAQRDSLYQFSSNVFVVSQLIAQSLYNRQALMTALVGTSGQRDDLARSGIAHGAFPVEGETLPFDAYNTYDVGLTKARSGTGKQYQLYGLVDDKAFDAILIAATEKNK